eukprot:PhM_4_TR5281/c0_g1_i2/m.34523
MSLQSNTTNKGSAGGAVGRSNTFTMYSGPVGVDRRKSLNAKKVTTAIKSSNNNDDNNNNNNVKKSLPVLLPPVQIKKKSALDSSRASTSLSQQGTVKKTPVPRSKSKGKASTTIATKMTTPSPYSKPLPPEPIKKYRASSTQSNNKAQQQGQIVNLGDLRGKDSAAAVDTLNRSLNTVYGNRLSRAFESKTKLLPRLEPVAIKTRPALFPKYFQDDGNSSTGGMSQRSRKTAATTTHLADLTPPGTPREPFFVGLSSMKTPNGCFPRLSPVKALIRTNSEKFAHVQPRVTAEPRMRRRLVPVQDSLRRKCNQAKLQQQHQQQQRMSLTAVMSASALSPRSSAAFQQEDGLGRRDTRKVVVGGPAGRRDSAQSGVIGVGVEAEMESD